jgi:hypothetical protein
LLDLGEASDIELDIELDYAKMSILLNQRIGGLWIIHGKAKTSRAQAPSENARLLEIT